MKELFNDDTAPEIFSYHYSPPSYDISEESIRQIIDWAKTFLVDKRLGGYLTLADIDMLHNRCGLGAEWAESDERKRLFERTISPIPRRYQRYPTQIIVDEVCYFNCGKKVKPLRYQNHSAKRTRSARWRAGTKRNKPKYNWTLKERGKK